MTVAVAQTQWMYLTEVKTIRLTIAHPDGTLVNIDDDVTAIEFEVKKLINGPDPALIRKTIGSGITVLPQSGDTLGQCDIRIESADTGAGNASWPTAPATGLFYYDIAATVDGDRKYIVPASKLYVRGVVNPA